MEAAAAGPVLGIDAIELVRRIEARLADIEREANAPIGAPTGIELPPIPIPRTRDPG